ncbi:hypothetical protein LTR56_011277 [Elasticomyces elasticus]|nr:hypothetical protein LTR56_011277 [Elasticomyces elasticus]
METVTAPGEVIRTPSTSTTNNGEAPLAANGLLATAGVLGAESNHGVAAAAQAVFDTVELLEMILIRVEAKTVLLSQRIGPKWRDVVETSIFVANQARCPTGEGSRAFTLKQQCSLYSFYILRSTADFRPAPPVNSSVLFVERTSVLLTFSTARAL